MWLSNFVSSWITAFSSACDVQTTCPVDGQTSCPVESLLSQVPVMVRLRVQLMVKLRAQLNHCFLKCLWGSDYMSSWITAFSSSCSGQTSHPIRTHLFSVQVVHTSAGDTWVVLGHRNWSIQVSVTFHTNNSNACNAFRGTGLYRSVWQFIQITVTPVMPFRELVYRGKCDSITDHAFQGTGLYRSVWQ